MLDHPVTVTIIASWLPYLIDSSCDLDLSHDKYQWEIWKTTAGKSAYIIAVSIIIVIIISCSNSSIIIIINIFNESDWSSPVWNWFSNALLSWSSVSSLSKSECDWFWPVWAHQFLGCSAEIWKCWRAKALLNIFNMTTMKIIIIGMMIEIMIGARLLNQARLLVSLCA